MNLSEDAAVLWDSLVDHMTPHEDLRFPASAEHLWDDSPPNSPLHVWLVREALISAANAGPNSDEDATLRRDISWWLFQPDNMYAQWVASSMDQMWRISSASTVQNPIATRYHENTRILAQVFEQSIHTVPLLELAAPATAHPTPRLSSYRRCGLLYNLRKHLPAHV